MLTWRDVPGYCDQAIANLYAHWVTGAPARAVFVELGSYTGQSALAFVEAAQRYQRADVQLVCVDLWSEWYPQDRLAETFVSPWACFRYHLREHLGGLVVAQPGLSWEARERLAPALLERVEGVFIDADHSYESVSRDIASFRGHRAALAGHDYDPLIWPGVVRAVDELVGPVTVRGSVWAAATSHGR